MQFEIARKTNLQYEFEWIPIGGKIEKKVGMSMEHQEEEKTEEVSPSLSDYLIVACMVSLRVDKSFYSTLTDRSNDCLDGADYVGWHCHRLLCQSDHRGCQEVPQKADCLSNQATPFSPKAVRRRRANPVL